MRKFLSKIKKSAIFAGTAAIAAASVALTNPANSAKKEASTATPTTPIATQCETYPINFEYTNTIQKLCNSQYTSYFNKRFRVPEVVVETLEPIDFKLEYVRDAQFIQDPRVLDSPKPQDYNKSGWDRGHLSAASNTSYPKTIQESFLMTNIAPQSAELNRGLWKTLEGYAKLRGHHQKVLVISGTYFESCYTPKWFNNIAIPDGFWKVIAIEGNEPLAWKFPNSKVPHSVTGKLVNYQIELKDVPKSCNTRFNLQELLK